MRAASVCPSKLELQQLLQGECAQADAETLENHVEGCESCQELLQTLDVPDVLVQAARAAALGPSATPPQDLARLMAHLGRMSPQQIGSKDTAAGEATGRDTDLNISALLAPPQRADEMGRLGAYRILGILGQGGMGVVFRAEDVQLHRMVALKVINPRLASNALARERFLREARSAAAIEHDHIVPLYHVGEERGVPFLAFPLLKGETLEDRLKREENLPVAEVLRIGRETAEGLAAAHAQGLIHRDIKPANIWLEDKRGAGVSATGGRVKILDFGLAGAITEAHESIVVSAVAQSAESLTQTGAVFGTPGYMSPEQARGAKVDGRSDLYSLGVIFYRLVTGELPFRGNPRMLLEQVLTEDPRPPRQLNDTIPRDLETITLKCLAKAPEQRYATAGDLAADLRRLSVGEPIRARPVGPTERAVKWVRRRPLAAALIGLGTAAVVILVVAVVLVLNEQGRTLAEQKRTLQAQSERVRAQVDTLLDANSAAVPTILEGLAPFGEQVLPRLREVLDQQDPPDQTEAARRLRDQHRTRAALALLAVDPGQVVYLRERMLAPDLDPEEMLLLREQLAAKGPELKEALWDEARREDVAPAQRFRELAALARFDPDNPRWPDIADSVVEPLLAVEPLHLGVWTRGLAPIRTALIGPLMKRYQDRSRTAERRVLVSLLQDYTAEQPDKLVTLLADADERSFAVLLPTLQTHGDRIIPLLHQELERQTTASWQDAPPEPAWGEPAAAVRELFEAADGMLEERFAWCQTMPLEQFDAVAEQLRGHGYRPVRLRPYGGSGRMQVAAVWKRDDRDWQTASGLNAAEVQQTDAVRQQEGWVPTDVAGYLAADGDQALTRYAVIWSRGGDEEARLYVGASHDQRNTPVLSLAREGFVPSTLQALVVKDGEMPSYSGVCRKGVYGQHCYWNMDQAYYEDHWPGELHVDVSVVRRSDLAAGAAPELAQGDGRYTDVWHESSTHESLKVDGLDVAAHQERGRQLAAEGWRPASVSVAPVGDGTLMTASIWHRPLFDEQERDLQAQRQANMALVLLRLRGTERVWPLWRYSIDPSVRSYLIHRVAAFGVPAQLLTQRLQVEQNVSARRALILSLGEYGPEQLPRELRQPLVAQLLAWYRTDPDAGLHGAIDWLLRHSQVGPAARPLDWQQAAALEQIDRDLSGQAPTAGRGWYINSWGQTFTLVPGPVEEFWMGSRGWESDRNRFSSNEALHRVRIGRNFAMATKSVTVRQFQEFLRAHPEVDHYYGMGSSPEPDGPITSVTWYEAAGYCRWRSEQEEIPEEQMCYPPLAKILEATTKGTPLDLPKDYLSRTGYRLPTEAEWEYACRAGAETSHYYGNGKELLSQYAWYQLNANNRTWPVGQKQPNDNGLFDMHGNVWTWCHEAYNFYWRTLGGKPFEDKEDTKSVDSRLPRTLRGGSFLYHDSYERIACRLAMLPAYRNDTFGFRLARTYP